MNIKGVGNFQQPNWEYKMWKFQDFPSTQISREVNFGHFKAPKIAILTILAALKFDFLEIFDISKNQNSKVPKLFCDS